MNTKLAHEIYSAAETDIKNQLGISPICDISLTPAKGMRGVSFAHTDHRFNIREIHVCNIDFNMLGKDVSDIFVVDYICSIYHEVKHIIDYDRVFDGTAHRILSDLYVADEYNPVFYISNYGHNIREIAAEQYGIKKSSKLLQKYLESDSVVYDLMKSRVFNIVNSASSLNSNHIYHLMNINNIKSVDDILFLFDMKLYDVYNKKYCVRYNHEMTHDIFYKYIVSHKDIYDAFIRIPANDICLITKFASAVSLRVKSDDYRYFENNAHLNSFTVDDVANFAKKTYAADENIIRQNELAFSMPETDSCIVDFIKHHSCVVDNYGSEADKILLNERKN